MEKENAAKEPERTKEKTEEEIIMLAINDWGNEFVKSVSILEVSIFKKSLDVLFISENEKYVIKQLWERYNDINERMVSEIEGKYPELKEMKKVIEENEKTMEEIYDFIAKTNDKKTDEFWNQINIFLGQTKEQWKKFKKNKDELRKKYEHQ